MKAVTVCVEFDDLLRVTLPRYLGLFESVLVVTSEDDKKTVEYVTWLGHQHPNVDFWRTHTFETGGAQFNKGLALEGAMDQIGREGWICVFDADMMLPEKVVFPELRQCLLYGTRRYELEKKEKWPAYVTSESWKGLPYLTTSHDWPVFSGRVNLGGHFLLFHASDPQLRQRPWFSTNWIHAGGHDSDFVARWPAVGQVLLPFDLLHLGKHEHNWMGRREDRLDGAAISLVKHRGRMMQIMADQRSLRGNYSGEMGKGGE